MLKAKILITISMIVTLGCNFSNPDIKKRDVMNKNLLLNDHKISYIEFLNRVIQKFELNDFQETDIYFGRLKYIAHKNNNYKKEQAIYRETYFNNNFQIHLIKQRNINYWEKLTLLNRLSSLSTLPLVEENSFKKDLFLVKKSIDYDNIFKVYKYKYIYKNKIEVIFVVDEKDFNNKEYPNNYVYVDLIRMN